MGGQPQGLTARHQLRLVQDLQGVFPAQAAGEEGPWVVEGGQRDGGLLTSILQAPLPLSGLGLCSQLPQNLCLRAQAAAVRADGAGGGDGVPQADSGGWEADAPALLQAWGGRGRATSHPRGWQSWAQKLALWTPRRRALPFLSPPRRYGGWRGRMSMGMVRGSQGQEGKTQKRERHTQKRKGDVLIDA